MKAGGEVVKTSSRPKTSEWSSPMPDQYHIFAPSRKGQA